MRLIEYQLNILPDSALPTAPQLEELVRLGVDWRADVVKAGTGGGGLPATFLSFSIANYENGAGHGPLRYGISGGIDAEGRVST